MNLILGETIDKPLLQELNIIKEKAEKWDSFETNQLYRQNRIIPAKDLQKLEQENKQLKENLEKIESGIKSLLPFDEFDNVIITPDDLKTILKNPQN